MPITTSDVPARYDLVLQNVSTATSGNQTFGFVLADSIEPSLPFRTHRAIYDITATFISRANTTGIYGDNQQDFWMTWNQEDWSLGEDQKFFRINDADRIRRYWQGSNVDMRVPGQVTIRPPVLNLSMSSAVNSGTGAVTSDARSCIHSVGTHDVFEIAANGTFVSKGEHGLGRAPDPYGTTFDGKNTMFSADAASAVRSWSGTAFSTFSASQASSLAYLNNTLFGFRATIGDLVKYDTGGVATSIFTWQDAKGAAIKAATNQVKMIPFGGKLIILRCGVGDRGTSEVWQYDGTAVSKMHQFEENFLASDIETSEGVLFIAGGLQTASGNSTVVYPTVFYIANGTIGKLWKSLTSTTAFSALPITAFDGGLAWPDYTNGAYVYYSPETGGITRVASAVTSNVTNPVMVGSRTNFVEFGSSTSLDLFPNAASVSSSATITSSLYDFDNSLDKVFRSVKVEWAAASDGNGGSVDIAYLVGDVSGTFTSLVTGATSGVENVFPTGVVGRNITIKVTLNKGTSTNGPVLRRMYVRCAPLLQTFRSGTYILDLNDNRQLRDGSNCPTTAQQQLQNLLSAAKTTTPFTVKDKSGTFTALVDLQDPEGFDVYEIHPIGTRQSAKAAGSYLARIKLREV